MKPRFLLDEHIPRAIQRQLRRQHSDLEILAIGDSGAPPAGTSDPDILNWVEQNNYILVTKIGVPYQHIYPIIFHPVGTFLAYFGFVLVLVLGVLSRSYI